MRKLYIFLGMLSFAGCAIADQELPRSVDGMIQDSDLVFIGKILEVKTILEKPYGPLTVFQKEAKISIQTLIQKRGALADYKSEHVTLRYQIVPDPRFKGERIDDLKMGETYEIFGRKVEILGDGSALVYIRTRNEIREVEQAPVKK